MYRYGEDSPLEKLSGAISDADGFLHRYLDTGFKTKWTGFWIPPYKYLDYYSLKINGVWLNRDTLQYVEYGDRMIFHHELDTLDVKETVRLLEDGAGFRCSLEIENLSDEPTAVRVALEAGVDIRSKDEDLGPDGYGVEKDGRKIEVAHGDRYLKIEGGDIEGESYVKEHKPGERQRCLVPGEIVDKLELKSGKELETAFRFSTDQESHEAIPEFEKNYGGKREYLYKRCLESMENLSYRRNGAGIVAGHPWFQSYWARDALWTVLGLVDAGQEEVAEEILENYAERDLPGKIDLENGAEEKAREDTYPLFVIASEKLGEEKELSDELEDACEEAMDELELEDNVVVHGPDATWMDTLERSPAVEMQSLWLEAANLRDDPRKEKLEKGLQRFCSDDIMEDSLEEDSARAVNFAVPLMFGHLEQERAEKYLETLNAEFTSKYGARTRSATDPGYDSQGYHTGSVWGLTTCWAAAANARYGKNREALNLLDRFSGFLERDQPGALPEVVDAETGELLGCPEQAWSAGLTVHVLESYIDQSGEAS